MSMVKQDKRKMKPSGVDWIGDVPEGWGVQRVGLCFRRHGSGTTPASTNSAYYEGENNWVQSGDLHGDAISKTEKQLSDSALQEYSLTVYKAPFIAVAMYGASIANTSRVMIDACTNQACCVLYEPEEDFGLDYCFYAIKAARKILIEAGRGGGQPNINRDVVRKLKIPIPSFDEQRRIAAKLDRLCGRVDELTENLKGEIAALQEYRKSLITECVTKGLNPKVKMKPSGVDWIGRMPEGWYVEKIKYLVGGEGSLFMDGDWINSDIITTEGVRYLTSGNVGIGFFKRQGDGHISYDNFKRMNCLKALPGDLMLCRLNEPLGRGCIIPEDESYYVIAVDNVILRPDEGYDRRFIMYCVSSERFSTSALIASSGATMQRISRADLGRLQIPIPPFVEQCRIAALLDERCAVIDAKIAERQRQLEKLGEYRSSVIYEYVTGKKEVAA